MVGWLSRMQSYCSLGFAVFLKYADLFLLVQIQIGAKLSCETVWGGLFYVDTVVAF